MDNNCLVPQEDLENDADSYMRMALQVGQAALEIGEVPVGCVIVLRRDDGDSVVISHGANQVNCTRDATRHAEIVAIDRLLTGGQSSDLLRLPPKRLQNRLTGISPKPRLYYRTSDDNCYFRTSGSTCRRIHPTGKTRMDGVPIAPIQMTYLQSVIFTLLANHASW
jgi:hypothetical protein